MGGVRHFGGCYAYSRCCDGYLRNRVVGFILVDHNTPTDHQRSALTAMTNVVTLHPDTPDDTPEYLLVCECRFSSFHIMSTNQIRCTNCNRVMDDDVTTMRFNWDMMQDSQQAPLVAPEAADQGLQRRISAKRVNDPDTVAFAVFKDDGAAHIWSTCETPERQRWLLRRIRMLFKLARSWVVT